MLDFIRSESNTSAASADENLESIADAVPRSSRKVLREYLQQHDTLVLVQSERQRNCYAAALIGSLLTVNFMPEFVRASHYCFSTISAEASQGCRANAAPALGALMGVATAAFAGYALSRGANAVSDFVQRKDAELDAHYSAAHASAVDKFRGRHLISRYDALTPSQRRQVKRDLSRLSGIDP